MNPVSRKTGEGRAEFLRTWGPGFDQKGGGLGGKGGGLKYVTLSPGENNERFDIHVNNQTVFIFPYISDRAGDRKRYTATIPRHRVVQQNTPRFLAPIRDADWSTQPPTSF